jgi:hypothetical protein
MLARQSAAAVISSPKADNILPATAWCFALVLLGLAAALIMLATEFPEFFVGGLDHFGPDVP